MNDYIMCPKCRHTNSALHWDANTRLRLGLIDSVDEHIENPEDSRYLPINGDPERIKDTKAEYNCPICGEVVAGTDVIRSK